MTLETKNCQNCPDKFSKAKLIRDPRINLIIIKFIGIKTYE